MILLRDLLESVNVQGKLTVYAMDEHQNAVSEGTAEMDGEDMAFALSAFADSPVRYLYPTDGGIAVEVDSPAETEIYYTGGGIDCAVHKLPDGTWFSGATNEFGCIYSTRQAAIDSFGDDENLLRYVEDLEEQKKIWRDIYKTEIERGGDYADECRKWLVTLDSDLSSMWAG